MRKNHRRDPIDDSLLYFLLFLHLEKNPSQSVFLSFFISPPPNCLYLIRPQKLFSSQLRTTSSLRSFRSISVPPKHRRVIEKLVVFSRIMPLTRSNGACTSHDGSIYRYQRLHPNPGLPPRGEEDTCFTLDPNLIDSRVDHAFFSIECPPLSTVVLPSLGKDNTFLLD